jgi:hypothetical protein
MPPHRPSQFVIRYGFATVTQEHAKYFEAEPSENDGTIADGNRAGTQI